MPWQDAGGPGDLEEAEGNRLPSFTSMADDVRIVSFIGARDGVTLILHICVKDIPVAGFLTCLPRYGD